jgi:hypothetical protein
MNKKMTSLILMTALLAPGNACWADDTNADCGKMKNQCKC